MVNCLGIRRCGGMVDTRDLKSLGRKTVPVRVGSPAPNQQNPNQIFPMGDGFGFCVFYRNQFFSNGALRRPESKPRGPRKKKSK